MSPDGLVTGELAPVLSSDLNGGGTSFNVISAREQAAVHEVLVVTLCKRALLAMTHSRWSQAEALAGEARTIKSQAYSLYRKLGAPRAPRRSPGPANGRS
jgi:hypothetical protein